MNKILLLLSSLLVVTLVACEGPAGRDGLNGRDGKDGVMNWDVWRHTVASSDWLLSGTEDEPNSYYYYNVSDENLTKYISESSLVTVYVEYDDADGNAVFSPLPVVRHYVDSLKAVDNTDSLVNYTQTFDYEFKEGVLTFAVTRSDFKTSNRPNDVDYRIVYNW